MADEVKNGLSADKSRIASKWDRNTVADGSWLQKYTLNPLTARDYYLASAIDALCNSNGDSSSALSAAISSVSSIHDEYINYLSDTISGDISGYIEYISGSVDTLSGDFKTSVETLLNKIDEEHGRADAAETKINTRLNNMEAATDVIDVYGSWDDFTNNSSNLFTVSGITDNDIIKILNDKNSYPNEMFQSEQNVASGHQTYFRWINTAIPESAHIKPLDPTSGYWEFIGYVDPYYTTTEIDQYINELSATVKNNYLSASTDAVSAGKNIIVTKEEGPVIGIKTKNEVEFTKVNASTAQGNSANFTNVNANNVIATNIQGTQANYTNFSGSYITGVNGDTTVTATISGLIKSAIGGGAMAGIHNISEIEFRNQEENITTDLATSADKLIFVPSAGCENWLRFSKGNDSTNNNEQVININAPDFVSLIDDKLNKFDFTDWSGSTASLFSGTSRSSQSAGSASLSYSSTTAYAAQNVGDVAGADLIGSAQSGYNAWSSLTGASWYGNGDLIGKISAGISLSAGEGVGFKKSNNTLIISAEGKTYTDGDYISITENTNKINVTGSLITSSNAGSAASAWVSANSAKLDSLTNISAFGNGITNTATYNLSAIKLSAGQGIGFNNDTDGVLSISAEGRAYTGENYVKVDNTTKKIGLSGNIVGSAESGQSAYDWITTKSATLSAGPGIGFYSAGPNILGISAEGTSYQAGDYISTSNKTIAVTGDLITSANAGSAASAWINSNNTKIAYSEYFKGSSNVITGYGTSSFAGGISSISVLDSVFTGRNIELYDSNNIVFTTGNNSLTIDLHNNITLGESDTTQIYMKTSGEDIVEAGPVFAITNNNQSQLQLYNNKIKRNGEYTTWDKVISASNGKYVSAYNKPITIATATTLPTAESMVDGVYYIV